MNLFQDLIKKLETIPMEEILSESTRKFTPEIEDLNTAQLDEGKRSDGSFLPDYSPTSVSVYGKPAGPIRLFDEGDFWEGITAETSIGGIDIEGKDEKTEELEFRYGDDILGLTENNQEILQGLIVDDLIEGIRTRI